MELPFVPNFNGKTAVVTGGAGVLCGMFARALAACGAKVAILDLADDKAKQLAEFAAKPVLQYVGEGIRLFVDGVSDEKKYFEEVRFLSKKWRKELASEAEVMQGTIVRRYLEMLAVRAAEKTLAEAAMRYLPEKAYREFLCFLDRVSLLRCCHPGWL